MKNLVITFDDFIFSEQLNYFLNEFENIDFKLISDVDDVFSICYNNYNKILIFKTSISESFTKEMEYISLVYDVEIKYFYSHEIFYMLYQTYNIVGD